MKEIGGCGSFAYLGAMFKPADLFDLSQTEHAAMFDDIRQGFGENIVNYFGESESG